MGAEADPYYGYYGLGYRGYGYGLGHYGYGLGYRGYYGGYYGKRSADAEPTATADAEADPYYGYYGLGYHGYGYHGLGYRAYGYGLGHYGYGMVCTDTTDKCPADSNHPKTSLVLHQVKNGLFSLVHSPPVLPVSVPPG